MQPHVRGRREHRLVLWGWGNGWLVPVKQNAADPSKILRYSVLDVKHYVEVVTLTLGELSPPALCIFEHFFTFRRERLP